MLLPAAAAITPDRLRILAPRCDAAGLAPLFDAACAAAGITTPARVRNFMAQVSVETWSLTRWEEDLDYSDPAELVRLWPAHIPTLSLAQGLLHQPEKLADLVYADRFGNTAPGDGWRYRGRGGLQVTFKDNYLRMTPHAGGVDLVADPDALSQPATAIGVAATWWAWRGLNSLADHDEVTDITRLVNGGLNGLAAREAAWKTAVRIWPGAGAS